MKKGFTIIEVALVLAIAGLIFAMVFIALPGLRASQRDTNRREDIISLINSIKKFQQNNRGGLPSGTGANISYNSGANSSTWAGFYRDFLGEDFIDPSGEAYKLTVQECGAKNVDDVCANGNIRDSFFPNGYTISIVLQASCKGEEAVQTSNPRKVEALYKLEGAGTFCSNT